MNRKDVITPASKITNPFEGKNSEEVWKELKSKSKLVNKEAILKFIRSSKG